MCGGGGGGAGGEIKHSIKRQSIKRGGQIDQLVNRRHGNARKCLS